MLGPHWIPFEPIWLFIAGLTLLAVVPHQVPVAGRRVLKTWMGVAAGLALSVWLFVSARQPVLGVAVLLFVAGTHISTRNPLAEAFASGSGSGGTSTSTKKSEPGHEVDLEGPSDVHQTVKQEEDKHDDKHDDIEGFDADGLLLEEYAHE